MCRFYNVLCVDFSMSDVNCSPNELAVRLAWLALLAAATHDSRLSWGIRIMGVVRQGSVHAVTPL